MAKPPIRRCAIYTRKSSEEGLEQDFNSLHAQREACEAYIRSQKAEGWTLVETAYDDGGFSGGSMERPALQSLMADIRAGLVDCIVVYKIDRLTRSLADFAKMVDLFDTRNVTFVSITQSFNTTSSMGRLTLNILLSFAQFEREVIGERVRDKIAASKRKGMWMGGNVPLGYMVRDRKLVVNPDQATTVKHIFTRYLELGSVRHLKTELDQPEGTKASPTIRSFSRGMLYHILSNPTYIGEVRHKKLHYPGQHAPIIDRSLWESVQQMLAGNHPDRILQIRKTTPSPLMGKLFDENCRPLTPSHSNKDGRRYRYYVSRHLVTGTNGKADRGWRIPAPALEKAVAHAACSMLRDRNALVSMLIDAKIPPDRFNAIFASAESHTAKLTSEVDATSALEQIVARIELGRESLTLSLMLSPIVVADLSPSMILTKIIPTMFKKRGVELRLIVGGNESIPGNVDLKLVKAIARAQCWAREITTGQKSLSSVATDAGVSRRYVHQLLPLAFLAPDIIEAIMDGRQPVDIAVTSLTMRTEIPTCWDDQRRLLGFH